MHAYFMMQLCNHCLYALIDERMHTRLCSKKELLTTLIIFGAYMVVYAYKCMYLCMMHALGYAFLMHLHSFILHVEDGHFEPYLKKIGGLGQKLCLNAIVCRELN
jgi:hypothetical protein